MVTEADSLEERLFELARGTVESLGYTLVDVRELLPRGRPVIRFTIDAPGGVTVADCEAVSRELDYLVEADDESPDSHVLEVSSPGLDHRLRKEREYRHFAGRLARLVLRDATGSDAVVVGAILGAEDGVVVLRDERGSERRIGLSDIARGRLVIEDLEAGGAPAHGKRTTE